MARAAVSGGGGYVGAFIVEALLAAGYDVLVVGRRPPPDNLWSAPARFAQARLDPGRDTTALFDGVELFVHAAFDHVPGRYRGGEGDDADGFWRRNVDGGLRMLRDAAAAGASRLIFLSSRAAYGSPPPGTALLETDPCAPDTLYGQAKLAVETALENLNTADCAAVSLRITGVYGHAGPSGPDKWSDLVMSYLRGEKIEPRAGTEVHGKDVAAAVLRVARAGREELREGLFNVSDLIVDRTEILGPVKARLNAPHPLPPRADAAAISAMDTARLEALGWRPGGRARLRESLSALAERIAADEARR